MPVLQRTLRFRLAGWLGALVVRLLYATWRVTVIDPEDVGTGVRDGTRPAVIAFWHRHLLTLLGHCRGYRVCVPVSEHRDGEYVAQVMERSGLISVRGSTTRGSLKLVRGLLSCARQGWSPAITPDGPRGPKYSVQPGVALLARRCGLPVYPVGIAVSSAWVLRSWDEFMIPKPWARIVIAAGPALGSAAYDDVDGFCRALGTALQAACQTAEDALRQAA